VIYISQSWANKIFFLFTHDYLAKKDFLFKLSYFVHVKDYLFRCDHSIYLFFFNEEKEYFVLGPTKSLFCLSFLILSKQKIILSFTIILSK